MSSTTQPQCPRCGAGQRQERLTRGTLARMQISLQREVAAHFDTAHRCAGCGASYSFRAGASFPFVAAGPKHVFWPLPEAKSEQT